jgi:hypothetical protein
MKNRILILLTLALLLASPIGVPAQYIGSIPIEDTSPTGDDLIETENSPASSPNSRKVQLQNAIQKAHGLTGLGFVQITSGGILAVVKANLSATAAPTANEDTGDGYAIGSLWIDTTNDAVYQCVDATLGAAVWRDLSAAGGGAGTIGGTTGNVDNILLRADGTGGATIQGSTVAVDDSGNITGAGSISQNKVSGQAGDLGLYEANSTDLDAAGWRGPASLTTDTSYRGQFPSARPTVPGSVMVWDSTASTGSGAPATPYVQPVSFEPAGIIKVISKSASYTLGTDSAREPYGYLTLVTSAATVTLPAAALGMSGCVFSTGANAVSIDVNASDHWVLNGTALSNGDKITSASGAGNFACFVCGAANTWYTLGLSGTWTDGN